MIIIDNINYNNEERIMKKTSGLLISLLVTASAGVYAESNLDAALKHAEAALEEGHKNNAAKLSLHAKGALDSALTASIVAKSISKNHINAAAQVLQKAIDDSALNQDAAATKDVEEAVNHLKQAKK